MKTLDKLRYDILEIEMDLALLEHDLNRLDINLYYLDKMQRDLIYNINILRQDNIISVLSEYHKSLAVLKEVKYKIEQIKLTRDKLQKSIENNTIKLDRLYQELEDRTDNILIFKKRDYEA